MMTRVEAGGDVAEAAARGGVVVLGPGVHAGPLQIGASVTLRGEPGAVLDGGGRGSVLLIDDDGLVVRVEGLTLRNGHAEGGGVVHLSGESEVVLSGCELRGGRAPRGGGGGAWAGRGRLVLDGCTFADNWATYGADLVATGFAEVEARGSRFAGDVAAREGARLLLDGCTGEGRLDARGTTTRVPDVLVRGSTFAGGIHNHEGQAARLEVEA